MLLLIPVGEFQAIMFHLFSTQYTFILLSAVYTVTKMYSPQWSFLAPAVTVGERRELWILPPFFLASSFAYNFVRK